MAPTVCMHRLSAHPPTAHGTLSASRACMALFVEVLWLVGASPRSRGQFVTLPRGAPLAGTRADMLVVARKLTTSREMLLWMTPSEAPKALQASECSELLDPMRASCWISAQH